MASQKSKLLWIAKEWPFTKLRPKLQFKNLVQNIHDRSHEHEQIAGKSVVALEALLNNKHFNNYPLSAKMLKPASAPNHYDKVLDAVDGKPIHKSFLQRFLRL